MAGAGGAIAPLAGHIPFFSTVTGAQADGTTLDGAYWWHNIRRPVRFAQALAALTAQGYTVYAEIGPHPVLRGYINDSLKAAVIPVVLHYSTADPLA